MNEIAHRIRLDSEEACIEELERCSNGMASLTQEFTRKSADLGRIAEYLDLVKAVTLLNSEGANKEEREAKVITSLYAVSDIRELVEMLTELETDTEVLRKRLASLERRGSNAQSALGKHRDENKLSKYQGVANL